MARSFYWEEKMAEDTGRALGRIVVGVDGTTASAAAVRWAVREALLRQASVHLVFADDHDLRDRAPYAGWWTEARPDAGEAAATVLDAAEQQASQALPPARLSSERADGSPSRVLIERSAGATMLVLGSAYQAGRSASDAWPPMGPVTRDCLHGASCPVVVMASSEEACAPDA